MSTMTLTLGRPTESAEARLGLPASQEEVERVLSTLDEHAEDISKPIVVQDVQCEVPGIYRHICWSDITRQSDLQSLNRLAEKIGGMDERQKLAFAGALSIEPVNSLDDVLTLTDRLDGYVFLPNIGTDQELGRFLVDTGYKDFPKNVRPYLDYGAIGAEYCANHAGSYVPGGYVRRKDSQPGMEEGKKPVFLLHLTARDGATQYILSLPASEERLGTAKQALEVDEFCQADISRIECSFDGLARYLAMDTPSVETINEVASELEAVPSEDMRKLCAVCEVCPPVSWEEMRDLVTDLDDYEFCPEDPEQYGREAADHLRSDVDALLEELEGYVDYEAFGEQQMEADGVRFTAYGNLRRLSEPLPEEPDFGQKFV